MSTVTIYDCCNQVFDPPDFAAHLRDVHHLDPHSKCTWQGVMFVDGSGFSLNVHTCTLGDITIKRTVTTTKDKPMPKPSLKSQLADQLTAAESFPGTPQRLSLGGGLRIDLKLEAGIFWLQLSRTTAPGPALKELQTTLEHWPAPLPAGIPDLMKAARSFYHKADRRHYLALHFARVEPLPLDSQSTQENAS